MTKEKQTPNTEVVGTNEGLENPNPTPSPPPVPSDLWCFSTSCLTPKLPKRHLLLSVKYLEIHMFRHICQHPKKCGLAIGKEKNSPFCEYKF